MKNKLEEITGNIFAFILISIIIWSIFYTITGLLFKDKNGIGMYGNRGSYIYDDYSNN